MPSQYSHADFENLSWHDNIIYGLGFDVGDSFQGDWHSDLVLDIDHIVEWVREADQVQFRVAPATLTFHNVTDLRVAVDFGDGGQQISLHELSIDMITRERVENQKICLDRPYYDWLIGLNVPRGGTIAFGASGFTQSLRATPVLCDEQRLPAADRAAAD